MSRESANVMLRQIGKERREQIARWGAHDREHPLGVWATILCEQVGRLAGEMIRNVQGQKGSHHVHYPMDNAPSWLLFRLVERAAEVAAVALAIGEYCIERLAERGDVNLHEEDSEGKVYDDGQ